MITQLDKLIKTLESGSRPKGGVKNETVGIPSLGAEHLNSEGGFNFKKVKYIGKDFFSNQKTGLIEKEDILVVKDGATTGKVSFVGDDFPYKQASINEHIFKITLNKNLVIPKYAYWHLFSLNGKRQIMRDFRGATVGGISRSFTKNIQFHLPSLEDQKRIVKFLDEADALRQKRKQVIELLDNYLKSIFWKMFETSINDSATYQPIGKATDFIDYRGKTPEKSDFGIPLITAKHVKKGFFSFDPKEYITEEKYNEIMTRGFPRPNDVLFTTEGATLGNVCRIPLHIDKFGVGQRLITLQCKDCLTSEYLHFILLNGKIRLEIFKQATGSAAQGIRSAIFYKIKIPIPPKKIQERFSVIVQKTESLKQNMLAQSEELENQFQALMQKAFKGAL